MDVKSTLEKLSLDEKVALLQGWTTWTTWNGNHKGVPEIFMSDGPHGIRKQAGAGDHLGLNASLPATCFPTAASFANSWNVELGEVLGEALGKEAAALGVDIILGPGMNIKRSPLCGRNFEYFSEDPYLSGKMAAAYVKGIQSTGVSACPKHFAVNSQELRRMCMNSVVDERTLREIYLTSFEMAVKDGGAKTIMSSYNQVNGTYANENKHLLGDILRGEWGFEGVVVTDWGGDNNHTAGIKAGANIVMPAPGPDCAIGLIDAYEKGEISIEEIDKRVTEVLNLINDIHEKLHKDGVKKTEVDFEKHHELAKQCSSESIVLLENDGILPLDKNQKVVIIGDFGVEARYQGAGSSQVNPTKVDSLDKELRYRGIDVSGFEKGYIRTDIKADSELIKKSVELAEKSDVVLLCVGLDEISESEGMDREHLNLSPSQHELIKAVCAVNGNVVLVLSGGAPFVIPEGVSYRAAIHGYLGGQAVAAAMADALIGNVNPSGKLNESWPYKLSDVSSSPYFPSKERNSEYREGIYVGYRYYDKANVDVRYCFGHGLSYTDFEYENFEVNENGVGLDVKNVGKVDGAEVVQIYVGCKNGKVFRPLKELKGFKKVYLKAGEVKRINIPFDDKTFRYFNVKTNKWEVESADYVIYAASSSRDIRLEAQINIKGGDAITPYESLEAYESGNIMQVSDVEFEKLLGHSIPDGSWQGKLDRNDAICQMYYAKSFIARKLYKMLTGMKEKSEAKGKPDLNILFLYNMPFRALAKMSGGIVSEKMVDDIVHIVNGHFFSGLGKVVIDFISAQNKGRKYKKKISDTNKK